MLLDEGADVLMVPRGGRRGFALQLLEGLLLRLLRHGVVAGLDLAVRLLADLSARQPLLQPAQELLPPHCSTRPMSPGPAGEI